MSLRTELTAELEQFNDINTVVNVKVDKINYHGVPAITVKAEFENGLTLEGRYTDYNADNPFGGVDSSGHKNIVQLFTKKVDQVMRGTHERN